MDLQAPLNYRVVSLHGVRVPLPAGTRTPHPPSAPSPLSRGEKDARLVDLARSLNRVPFAPAIAGEKVPKADEGAGACATPAQDDEVVLDHRRFHAVNRR